MKHVLLVEDEQIVRLALRSLTNWEDHGFDLTLDAFNGQKALEMLATHPVDLVLSDLKMPGMDGFELLEAMRGRGIETPVIVLSAYDEYDSVRRAFTLGASDYIIKSRMSAESVLEVMRRVLSREGADDLDSAPPAQVRRDDLMALLDERCENPAVAAEKLGLSPGLMIAVCLHVDRFSSYTEKNGAQKAALLGRGISDFLDRIQKEIGHMAHTQVSPAEHCIVLSFSSASRNAALSRTHTLLSRLHTQLHTYFNITFTAGISDMFFGVENLPVSYAKAAEHSLYRLAFGFGRDIHPEMVGQMVPKGSLDTSELRQNLLKAFDRQDADRFEATLKEMSNRVKAYAPTLFETGLPYFMDASYALFERIGGAGGGNMEILEKSVRFFEHICRCETYEDVFVYTRNFFLWAMDLQKSAGTKHSHAVTEALKFMRANYAEDISLKLISEYVELSESYFSALFSQETGMGFLDALKNIRISHAKTLLKSTNLKVYEVAEKVGFSNTEHFCRVFKKITGVSAVAYKRI